MPFTVYVASNGSLGSVAVINSATNTVTGNITVPSARSRAIAGR